MNHLSATETISLRDYFAAHAPAMPADYKPLPMRPVPDHIPDFEATDEENEWLDISRDYDADEWLESRTPNPELEARYDDYVRRDWARVDEIVRWNEERAAINPISHWRYQYADMMLVERAKRQPSTDDLLEQLEQQPVEAPLSERKSDPVLVELQKRVKETIHHLKGGDEDQFVDQEHAVRFALLELAGILTVIAKASGTR